MQLPNIDFPHIEAEHPLKQILDSAYRAHGVTANQATIPKPLWAPERYLLDRSKKFQRLSSDQQAGVMTRISELNLALSYYIEKSGHHYGAKMITLSQSLEEKSLYALFAAEEALHLRLFMNQMWFQPTIETHFHPMIPHLDRAITWGKRDTLVFVIQVLLEGFGISHYASLKDSCLDQTLKESFSQIIKDEARHHGAGLILCNGSRPDRESLDQIFELSRDFVKSLSGANWALQATELYAGEMSENEKREFLEETRYAETIQSRSLKLKEMFEKASLHQVYERLEAERLVFA